VVCPAASSTGSRAHSGVPAPYAAYVDGPADIPWRCAYRSGTEPPRLPTLERAMADKSPRHSMSKKSGKSIKEKRVERKAKADTTSQMERLTRDKKH
jgi:hypothetical protein